MIPAESGHRAGCLGRHLPSRLPLLRQIEVPVGLTVLLAVAFLAVLTLIFATIDPCAQGPA